MKRGDHERDKPAATLLCGTLQVIVQTLGSASDDVKRNTLGPRGQLDASLPRRFRMPILHGAKSNACPNVHAVSVAVGEHFATYMDAFIPFAKIRIRKSRGAQV